MCPEPSPLNASTSRREFAKTALAAAAVPVLAPLAACASAAPPAAGPAGNPAPGPVAAPASPAAPPQQGGQQPPDPVSIHLTEALKAKYGDRLSAEQWEEVRKGVEGNLRAGRALRQFEIPIQTEPAFVFRAYRGGER